MGDVVLMVSGSNSGDLLVLFCSLFERTKAGLKIIAAVGRCVLFTVPCTYIDRTQLLIMDGWKKVYSFLMCEVRQSSRIIML